MLGTSTNDITTLLCVNKFVTKHARWSLQKTFLTINSGLSEQRIGSCQADDQSKEIGEVANFRTTANSSSKEISSIQFHCLWIAGPNVA